MSDGPYNPGRTAPEGTIRERVIAAIYESVIRPDLYDEFMDVWGSHISQIVETKADEGGEGAVEVDPDLQAHFARAYEIFEQIGRKTPSDQIGERIERAPGVALLLDARGELIAASPSARDLLGGDPALDTLRRALGSHSAELLGQMLRQADAGNSTAAPVILWTDWAPRHLVARIVHAPVHPGSGPSLTVVIESLEYRWSDEAEAMLVTSFGLSRAEVDLVRQLLGGRTLRQIAEDSGRSEHTVRNQAKSVLAKTGAPGQVDLIRMVVFLIRPRGASDGAFAGFGAFPETLMRMESTGKTVQVMQFGPRGGRPVIFLHGMIDGLAAVFFLREELAAANIRMIVPVRPGFGKSDPVARGEDALDVLEAHVREVIERLSLRRPVLMCHLAGNIYGQVLVRRLGKLLAGLLSISGNPPVTRVSQLARMPRRQRVVAYTARFAPALLPTILRAGIAQVDGQGVDHFRKALFAPGTHDAGVIERLDLTELLHAGFRFSVEQGMIGFATDSHLVVYDWSRHLGPLEVPVIMLHGERDPVVPPDSLIDAMEGIRGSEVRLVPEAGQLLMYEHPRIVLDALEELLAQR